MDFVVVTSILWMYLGPCYTYVVKLLLCLAGSARVFVCMVVDISGWISPESRPALTVTLSSGAN